jgi:hypothetical protein
MLVELDDFGTPWELARMTHELYPHRGRGSIVGPGVAATTIEQKLRMAQLAAAELFRHGLIEVRQGNDWHEETGVTVTDARAAALISDPITWKWPNQPERDIYAWFALTPAGTEAARTVSLDDIPSVPLPPPNVLDRTRSAAGGVRLRFLLKLIGWLARLESRHRKSR